MQQRSLLRFPIPSALTFCLLFAVLGCTQATWGDEALEFFEKRIRPVLVEHCYKCHSLESQELAGGLRLDLKAGWQTGGDSGEAALVPGKPEESLLIQMVRHDDPDRAMPPNQPRLPKEVVADLTAWVKGGAFDPREGKLVARPARLDWETVYQQRLTWWSLQPLQKVAPPAASSAARNEIDPFILAGLEAQGLQPVAEADRRTLARRLSFALTGLPPSMERVERFAADTTPQAYENFVEALLADPHFGEHWARHWMDVVHYADTHGYEWDAPAKNAWRYRDYLIRAFNADVSYQRFVLEQIAGDLLEPRIDPQSGLNESLIAPMALRLGERRHGDNAASEGVSQEAVSNVIDTVGKGFLGTTLACAQCHDHKLDSISQRDYFALAGVFMSTRWSVRSAEGGDPNLPVLARLKQLKQEIRRELAQQWLDPKSGLGEKFAALPRDEKAAAIFPNSLLSLWQRMQAAPLTAAEFTHERERRIAENKLNLKLVADFTSAQENTSAWRWEGWGMQHGLVTEGELSIAEEGDAALRQLFPAGRWSNAWSPRLAGAVHSPLFDSHQATTLSLGIAGGQQVAHAFIVDQAFHSERMQFLNQPAPAWLTLTAGNFDSLEGSIDKTPRRFYLELATKSLNNYFPPRTAYGGLSENEITDPRSWFGITQVYEHPPGKPPQDELARFAPLFTAESELPVRFATLLRSAIERWERNACESDDAALLNEALALQLLPNTVSSSPELSRLVAQYREVEKELQSDRTVGSAVDWNEGSNERIGLRGSYTELGDEVPRGNIGFLGGPLTENALGSGRLELAHSIASEQNPLTARVYVNRVWQHLFGEGLVRTPDDFGHLGQKPSHPELLDYLAERFMREGWSTKRLIALMVTSATWRQQSVADPRSLVVDPENRLWHHIPLRRLEAESLRDALLSVSGRLDATLFGPAIDPYRTAEDATKRLVCGPLDGMGRRSIYTKMTLMEPPRLLALFNQPIPKFTVGRRDVTNVPDQALALLNDPFVVEMAKHWSERVVNDGLTTPEERAAKMFATAFARPASAEETRRLVALAEQSARLRQAESVPLMECQAAWQDVAHALFNVKEFMYVP